MVNDSQQLVDTAFLERVAALKGWHGQTSAAWVWIYPYLEGVPGYEGAFQVSTFEEREGHPEWNGCNRHVHFWIYPDGRVSSRAYLANNSNRNPMIEFVAIPFTLEHLLELVEQARR